MCGRAPETAPDFIFMYAVSMTETVLDLRGIRCPQVVLEAKKVLRTGKPVTLSQLRGSNVVLAFFPLAWTPI